MTSLPTRKNSLSINGGRTIRYSPVKEGIGAYLIVYVILIKKRSEN